MNDWIELSDRIALFREFLATAWDVVQRCAELSRIDTFFDDWCQTNWEQLVEVTTPNVILSVYGSGAEMYPNSSRVFRPDLMPTHAVVCTSLAPTGTLADTLSGSVLPSRPDGFLVEELGVPVNGGGFVAKPPFDHVRVGDHVTTHAFPLTAVRFWARPVRPEDP